MSGADGAGTAQLAPRRPAGRACVRCDGMYTGITVTTSTDGRVVAAVELRGTVCRAGVPALLAAIEDLRAMGVTDVDIDVSQTGSCDG